jgi:hypothetical protein
MLRNDVKEVKIGLKMAFFLEERTVTGGCLITDYWFCLMRERNKQPFR